MKPIKIMLTLCLAAAIAPITLAQDNSSQNTSGSKPGAGHDVTPDAAATYPTKQEAAKNGANDASLTQDLQSRLSQDPAFSNVQVSVTNGTAVLTGTVPSKADKKRAKDTVKSMSGVKHVREELKVDSSAGTTKSSDNHPVNASVPMANSYQSASTAGSATNPGSAETSATSSNPNSQSSKSVSGSASTSPSTAATSPSAASSTNSSSTASSANSSSAASGENASSAPQSTSGAASDTNMAGQNSASPASAASGSTGGVTGATAPSASGTTQGAATSGSIGANAAAGTPSAAGDAGVSANNSATLQSQIQDALRNEPTLRGDSINATVTDSTIELSGTAQTGKEKQTADRIASSFAGNRRVKDRVTVSGRGAASNSTSGSGNTSAVSGSNAPGSTSNPTSQNNSQNPSANNPAANGDASSNPR